MRRSALVTFGILTLLIAASAHGQTCPLNGTSSNKLVCLIPQVYGPFGFGSTTNPSQSVLFTGDFHAAHFGNGFLSTFAPINETVGLEVSELPLASPSFGTSFVFDPALKTFAPSSDESLGPILGERASTIGRHKIFFGFSYQFFNFSSIDGQNLNSIPGVLQHQPFAPNPSLGILACANQTGLTGTVYSGDPCFVRDYIQTVNNVDLAVHQYTIYLTYGITNRLDFSVAIPILDVRMLVASLATIVPQSVAPASVGAPGNVWHSFNPINPVLTPQCATQVPCLVANFSDSGSAAGIGDVILRGKYNIYRGERLGVSAGVDVRLPSGDATNFLGSGTTGVKPFGIISYRARVSPHAQVGYEINGDSILAGTNIVPSPTGAAPVAKGGLPDRLLYILGADVLITKRLTGAFDVYGQRLFSAPELVAQPYMGLGNCSGAVVTTADCPVYTPGTAHPDIAQKITDINIDDASLGLKFRTIGRLLVTGNVLIKMNDGGLRSKAVPLVGLSYAF
jgi:Putative MetA-pathway of phenol degradation